MRCTPGISKPKMLKLRPPLPVRVVDDLLSKPHIIGNFAIHHAKIGIGIPAGMRWEDTPGHGYLCVGKMILYKMPVYMQSTRYSRPGKYEEDCDWCLPIIPMLDYYHRPLQLAAIKTFYHWHPDTFERYFQREPVDSFKRQRQDATKGATI